MKSKLKYAINITFLTLLVSLNGLFAQAPQFNINPTQLTFNTTTGTTPAPQNLVIISNTGSALNFSASTFSSGNWLSVTPTAGTTPQTLLVSVNPGSMPSGSYAGFITITSGSSSSNVLVIMNVNSGTSPGLTATPSALSFSFTTGSNIPLSQTVNVGTSGTPNVTFTATPTANNGATWLSVNPASATTPSAVSVSVSPANLATGTYFGAVAFNAPGTSGVVVPVQVNVTPPSSISVSQQQLSFAYQLGTTAPTPQVLNITATSGATISFTANGSTANCGGNWLVVSPQSSATPSAVSVQINTTSLTAGNCTGTVNITAPSATNPSLSIPVNLLVSTNPLLLVPSASPTFNYQLGTAPPASQTVQVTSSSTPLAFTVSATPVSGGPNFLTVSPASGTTPQALTLTVNPTVLAGLAPSTYAETVTISSPGAGNPTQTFTATLVVSNNPILVSSQSPVNFNFQIGQASPSSQIISLTSTGAPLNYNVSVATTSCNGFLTATPSSGITPVQTGQQAQVVIGVNTNGLTTPQTCTGTITLSVPGSTNPPLTIPVNLNVSTTPLLNTSPSVVNVAALSGSTNVTTQQISLTSTDNTTALNFSATAVTSPAGLSWLAVTPNSGATPATLNILVNPTNLPAGTYTGTINITSTSPNVPPQTIPVTLTVYSASITVAPSSLSFIQPAGGSPPPGITVQVGNLPPGATLGAVATMLNGANWLTVNTSGNSFTVTANGSQLLPGTYSGVITLFVPGAANSPFNLPVSFTVGGAPLFTINPAAVNFTYQQSTAIPAAQTVQVTGASAAVPITAAVTAPSGTPATPVFATVTPASSTTPSTLSVALIPSVVSALAPGTYTNTVTLSTSAAGGSQVFTITLTVTAAVVPTVTSILNGADFLGGAVSPGEIVAIFGTNIGPSSALGLKLTSTGTVATTLGTTTVTFNGVPAPLIFVSATQINAIVPYEVASLASANVVVMNNGNISASFPVAITSTAPGIFAQTQNGSGQGSILNEDSTVNGANNPAARGSVIQIYGTGEGAITPTGVTGSVTPSVPPFPKINGPVTVTIGGVPATVLYAGEAPSLVSGVLQVNAIVPAGIGTGNQPVVVSVGGINSPNVITAAIK